MVIHMAKGPIGKFIEGFRTPKKIALDVSVLRHAKIEILTLDERWNNLFRTIQKTPAIVKAERAMTDTLKEQARLTAEMRDNRVEKRAMLGRILELTNEAFSGAEKSIGGDRIGPARAEVEACEHRVREINAREPEIEARLDDIVGDIKNCNLAMLESAVSYLYTSMKKSQERVAELDETIAAGRETLKERISERETLAASVVETYHFLHGLFGAEYIDPIDEHYA